VLGLDAWKEALRLTIRELEIIRRRKKDDANLYALRNSASLYSQTSLHILDDYAVLAR